LLTGDEAARLRFDSESETARLNAVQLSNLTAAWQIGKTFPQNHGGPPFRAPPHHCHEQTLSCRKKKRATNRPSVRLNGITSG